MTRWQVERAGSTMTEVVASVKRVTEIVAGIIAATFAQSSGLNEINLAMRERFAGDAHGQRSLSWWQTGNCFFHQNSLPIKRAPTCRIMAIGDS